MVFSQSLHDFQQVIWKLHTKVHTQNKNIKSPILSRIQTTLSLLCFGHTACHPSNSQQPHAQPTQFHQNRFRLHLHGSHESSWNAFPEWQHTDWLLRIPFGLLQSFHSLAISTPFDPLYALFVNYQFPLRIAHLGHPTLSEYWRYHDLSFTRTDVL